MYIFYVILYACLRGVNDIFKKFARRKSNTSTILALYVTVAFLLCLLWLPFDLAIPTKFIFLFALKGLLLAFSWFILIKLLKDADVSLVSTMQLFSTTITFVVGLTFFHETASFMQIIGIIIISLGVMLMSLVGTKKNAKIRPIHIILLLISATITSASSIMDKYTTNQLTNFQVQFWFMLFAFIFSWFFFAIDCIKEKRILMQKEDFKNWWIYIAGAILFVGDYLLFLAYVSPNSQMIIITILSKLKLLVTVLAGIIIFKEKDVAKKVLLTLFILIGVFLVALF